MQKEFFTSDLYSSSKYSMSICKANIVALIYPLPIVIVYAAAFLGVLSLAPEKAKGFSFSVGGNIFMSVLYLLLYFVGFFALIALHEVIHAIVFLRGCNFGRKSIVFGIKYATPYCHCKEVLTVSLYRQSLLAPLAVIGIPLAAVSFVTGNYFVFFVNVVMIFGSGGDLAVLWMIRKFQGSKSYVWDMDDEVGCIVYQPLLTGK